MKIFIRGGFYRNIKMLGIILGSLAALCTIIIAVTKTVKEVSEKRIVPPASEHFTTELRSVDWIAYEPINFDPEKDIYPKEDEILKDLETLYNAGFTGIITFDSKKTLASIPRLAREIGFKGVIMGVYEPTDKQSVHLAIKEAKYVDGYCIGHNRLGVGYDIKTLRKTMKYVRKRTGKPVSTTEYLVNYYKVADHVNWLFPDVGGIWRKTSSDPKTNSPDLLFKKFVEFVEEVDKLAISCDKSVLLKMISFPSGGSPEYTEEAQARFFEMVLNYARKDINFPRSVCLSFFSAFDIAWKKNGWDLTEQHVGIFRRDSSAKRAVVQFQKITNIYKYK